MKKYLNFILILGIIICLIFIFSVTYSKYLTQANNSINSNISNWNITLNNQNISDKQDFSEMLEIIYEENEHISNDVIVPTSTGYFFLTIDGSNTTLPFEYSINLENIDDSLPDFKILGFCENDNDEIIPIDPKNDNQISDIVYSDSEIKTKTFKIYLQWDDSENNVLDNASDVLLSKQTEPISHIRVNVNVSQYFEEEVEDIVEEDIES